MAISSRNKPEVGFSLSGMTDIVFLLLLFFMLVSTLSSPVAMNIILPQGVNQTLATPVVTISVTNTLEYLIDDKVCTFEQIETILKERFGNPSEPPTIRINADERIKMDELYKIMEIAKKNRCKVILGTRSL